MGRPPGRASRCAACGELGHQAAADGATCSRSARAVELMRSTGCTAKHAAMTFGVSPQAVSDYIRVRGGSRGRLPAPGTLAIRKSPDGDVAAAELADRADQ